MDRSDPVFMQTTRGFIVALVSGLLILAIGCQRSQPSGVIAPTKPLGTDEKALLDQIEALPADKRQSFCMQHLGEIQKYSTGNRAFGERLNVALGVGSTKN